MRGKIQNRDRAKQLRDFSGLRWGNITPSDIDMEVEFGDQLFISGEIKLRGVDMPPGQRLMYERRCDGMERGGRPSCVLVIEHDIPPEQDIPVAECLVVEYRWRGAWHEPTEPITCKDAIDILRKEVGIPL